MLSCPACGDRAGLRPTLLEEPAFRVEACGRCEGVWIPMPAYLEWAATQPRHPDAAEAGIADFESHETPTLRKCPTCASILGRYRVGHGIPFTIDRCYHCRGVWLDRHEWEALKARALHRDLHEIFDDAWQSDLRRRDAEEREDAYRRRVLGDDGVERLEAFIDWASTHPMRHLVLGTLLERLRVDNRQDHETARERMVHVRDLEKSGRQDPASAP